MPEEVVLEGKIRWEDIPERFRAEVPEFATADEARVLLEERGKLRLKNVTVNLRNKKSTLAALTLTFEDSSIRIDSAPLVLFADEIHAEEGLFVGSFSDDTWRGADGVDANDAEVRTAGANGRDGADGGRLVVASLAPSVGLTNVRLDLAGQDGGNGGRGSKGEKGKKGKRGRNAKCRPLCVSGPGDGKRGGKGKRGKPGGHGGDGGDGGDVFVLQVDDLTGELPHLPVFTSAGGAHGRGGPGGEGGDGGAGGAPGNKNCCDKGAKWGRKGPDGDRGRNGDPGDPGGAGVLTRDMVAENELWEYFYPAD